MLSHVVIKRPMAPPLNHTTKRRLRAANFLNKRFVYLDYFKLANLIMAKVKSGGSDGRPGISLRFIPRGLTNLALDHTVITVSAFFHHTRYKWYGLIETIFEQL